MKNHLFSSFLFSLLLFVYSASYAQQQLEIDVNQTGIISADIETILDNVVVRVRNLTPGPVSAHFVASLAGTDVQGRSIRIDNFLTDLQEVVITPGGDLFTIRRLIEDYQNSSLEEYNIAPAMLRDELSQTRRLPEGSYQLCVEALSYPFGELISEPLLQSCIQFDIQYLDPPYITSPDHNSLVVDNSLDEIIVFWTMPQARMGTTYLLEMVRFETRELAEIFESQGRPDDIFDALPKILEQDEINAFSFSTVQSDSPFDLNIRDIIAVRVTAINPESFIRQEGRSRIVMFHYGVSESSVCRAPNVTGEFVFPIPGDTIPYARLYAVTKIEPDCDNFTGMDYVYSFSSQGASGNNATGANVTYDYRASGSPSQYLTDFINNSGSGYSSRMNFYYPDGSDRHLYNLVYDYENSRNFQVNRGDRFAVVGRVEAGFNNGLTGSFDIRSFSFNEFSGNYGVAGMPKPKLLFPEEGLDIAPGVVGFGFNTGTPPSRLVPPYKMYTTVQGSVPTVLPLHIVEKCVLQIATNRDFTPESMVYSQVKKIQANVTNSGETFDVDNPVIQSFSPTYDTSPELSIDEEDVSSKVYKDLNTTTTLGTNGDYFWRVVWLTNPASVNVINPHMEGINITDDMIYHASAIRSFTISPDGVSGTGGTESEEEEELSECDRICNFTPIPESQRANVRNVNVGQIIRAGSLSIRITSITNGESGHTGTGVLVLPSAGLGEIKIRVRFSNIGININNRLVSGTITAETDDRGSMPAGNNAEREALVDAISWITRIYEATTDDGARLPLGLDITDSEELRIVCALDQINITSTGARATYLAGVKLPEEFNAPPLLFKAQDVCFNAEASTSTGKFLLAETIDAELDNGWRLGINGGSNAATSTYIEFDCDGFKEFAFRGKVTFSRNAIVPENATTGQVVSGDDEKVSAIFGTVITKPRPSGAPAAPAGEAGWEPRSENFIINISFDKPFQITSLEGVGFTVSNAILDFSEVSNHPSMTFPDEYDMAYYGERSGMTGVSGDRLRSAWTGFYLQTLELRLPKDVERTRTGIGIRDLLIDNSGLTVSVRAASGWAELRDSENGYRLSLDAFSVGVVQSRSVFFSLEGKIGLPIFREEDFLGYSAALVMGGPAPAGSPPGATAANLVFEIRVPRGRKLLIPMWDIAGIELDPATNVELSIGTTTRFSFGLTGTVSFLSGNNEERESDDITINMPSLRLENLRFSTSESGIKGRIVLVNGDDRTNLWSHTDEGGRGSSSGGRSSSSREGRRSGSGDSEQSNTAGFPINLEGISLGIADGTAIDAMTYDIRFMLSLSFSDQISAEGDLGFRFKLGDGGRINQFTLIQFLGPTSIEVEAKDLGGVEIMGRVSFCNQGLNERFIGALRVKLPSLGEIRLYADFGTQRDNLTAAFGTREYFSFFAIEGSVILSTGITLFPGVALYGLGGGVFYRMARNDNPSLTMPVGSSRPGERPARDRNEDDDEDDEDEDDEDDDDEDDDDEDDDDDDDDDTNTFPEPTALGCNNAPYRPDFNTFMGFKFKAYLGDNGGGSAYNLDVMIQAMLEGNDRGEVVGIASINFVGNLYVACNIGAGNDEAPLKATVAVDYTRSRDGDSYYEGIHGIIQVYLNLYVLTGVGENNKMVDAVFHGDNRGMWYFFLGAPKGIQDRTFKVDGRAGSAMANYPGPAGVKILDLMSLTTYFMIGKSIPDIPPIDEEIEAILLRSQGFDEKLTTVPPPPVRPSDMESADGFAHGLHFKMDNTFNFLLFYAKMKVIFGYDINFRFYEGRECLRPDGIVRPLGVNGWFAKGQAFAGLEGEFGIGVDFGAFSAKVPIIELGCAITMQAEFPNPEWFKARAGMYYTILDGAISGRASFVFEIGEKCYDPNYSPLDALSFISEILPEGSGTTFSRPTVSFLFPMEREMRLEDDQYSGPEADRPVYRRFTPRFEGVEVRKVSNNALVAMLPNVDEFNNGYSVRKYCEEELEGFTEYKIKATVIAFERLPGGSMVQVMKPGGIPWTNTKEVRFRTGAVQQNITMDNLVSTYPIINQRNFMTGENGPFRTNSKDGWLDLMSGARVLQPSGSFSEDIGITIGDSGRSRRTTINTTIRYELLLSPSDNVNPDAASVTVPVQFVSNRNLTYTLPGDLVKNQIYRARLIKRVTKTDAANGKPVNRGGRVKTGEVTRTSGSESTTAEIKGQKLGSLDDSDLNAFDATLLEFYFRTSKYNNLNEKFAAMTQNSVTNVWGILSINYLGDEPFDVFDKNGYFSPCNDRKVFEPLVSITEPYTDPTLFSVKNGIYKKSEDLSNTIWIHTFLNDPLNPETRNDLNQMMMNSFRGQPVPGQFLDYTRGRERVRVQYRLPVNRWTIPGQLPQNITLGTVSGELSGTELTNRRVPPADRIVGTMEDGSIISMVSFQPGNLTFYNPAGTPAPALPQINILNANPWEWVTDHNRLKSKVGSALMRFEQIAQTYSRMGSMPTAVRLNWNYWFQSNTTLTGTELSIIRTQRSPNYLFNTTYQLEVGYRRPKSTSIRKIPNINWRVSN